MPDTYPDRGPGESFRRSERYGRRSVNRRLNLEQSPCAWPVKPFQAQIGFAPEWLIWAPCMTVVVDRHRAPSRRGITIGGQVAPVTLGCPGNWSSGSGSRRDLGTRPGLAGPVKGFGEPHRNPTSPRHGGRSPQESHERNGTVRYTCYAC